MGLKLSSVCSTLSSSSVYPAGNGVRPTHYPNAEQFERLRATNRLRTPPQGDLPERKASQYERAYSEVENTLAIIAEIQDERTNEDGEITEPLSLTQVRTILEVGTPLERSLAILEAVEGGSEGAL
jgi:hypothetical protein